jgi:hypothetical protein
MPLAFGAGGYLFLVHFLSLPIESAMTRPEDSIDVATITPFRRALCSVEVLGAGISTFGRVANRFVECGILL